MVFITRREQNMKKTLFLTALALLAFGCSDSDKNDSEAKCGDGVVDTAAGEQCEPSLDTELTCASFDASKKWKEGGKAACSDQCKIAVGTCVEDLPAGGVCGDGTKNEGEACDKGSTAEIACSEFDASKTWKTGGSAACADDCSKILQGTCVEDKGDDNPDEKSECGDGDVTGDEVCDTKSADTIACSEFDANKTWKEGGAAGCATDCKSILQGTCVEAESEPAQTCGDGHVTGDEVCDTASNETILCSAFDKSVTWKSGKAACADDCKSILQGTCVAQLCNNGQKDDGEVCDPKAADGNTTATQACSAYDSAKTWKDGGVSKCNSDCMGYGKGTCEEDTTPQGGCSADSDCTGDKDKVCDTATHKCVECIQNSACGEGKICRGNVCVECASNADCADNKVCSGNVCVECASNADCGAQSEKPLCANNVCVKDDPDPASCKTALGQDIYWCQLIDDSITLNDKTSYQTVRAYFQTGSNVTAQIQAKLVYDGADDQSFKTMNAWSGLDAVVTDATSIDAKMARTTLTKETVKGAGENGIYYTMKLSADGTNWVYCARNREADSNNASALACGNKPFVPKADGGAEAQSSKDEVGFAKYKVSTPVTVTEFDFNSITLGNLSASNCINDKYGTQLCGTKSVNQCNENNCIVSRGTDNNALSVSGWDGVNTQKPEDKDLSLKAAIALKNVKLGADKNIFAFEAARNNLTTSPQNIIVSYSADNGNSYKSLKDVTLTGEAKVFQSVIVDLPSSVANSTIIIRLTPYGGSGLIRFDNLKITADN